MEKVYTQDWFTINISGWQAILVDQFQMKGKDNLTFLEIGCFEGRSSNYLLQEVMTGKNCSLHVIDTWEFGESQYRTFLNNTEENRDRVIIHSGESGKVLRRDFSDNMFDFIYVDGSHASSDVLQDAVLCHPLLKVGAIMIFDDYGWKNPNNPDPISSPQIGIDSFFNAYSNKYQQIYKGYQFVLYKIVN